MATDYQALDDALLVNMSKDGDRRAADTLIERYKSFVRAKTRAYFLVGADRDDIVQEGMIGLFKAIRDFSSDKQASFKYFADICITRQIITAVKTATRQKHSPLNSYISLSKPVYDDESERTLIEMLSLRTSSNPEDIMIDRENLKSTEQRIRKSLSKFELEVMELYISGKSYTEIAEKLGKQPKSIDNAIQRVKKKIQKNMDE
ncbi:MAG: RNA polymerase sporulation sigma factor SigH [Clostridia bacterium]|nr:RNA polymerase sporulation sigma factor SigH [Clostridia bacterium]